jgi:hypothetical protein
MATALDRTLPDLALNLLAKFGKSMVLRKQGGEYDLATGRRANFSLASATAAATVNTITRSSGSFVDDGVAVDGWWYVDGWTKPANNGWAKVLAVSALSVTLSRTLENETRLVAPRSGITFRSGTDYRRKGLIESYSEYLTGSGGLRGQSGDGVKAGDQKVTIATRGLDFLPDTNCLLYLGSDPATAPQRTVVNASITYSGELPALATLQVRA